MPPTVAPGSGGVRRSGRGGVHIGSAPVHGHHYEEHVMRKFTSLIAAAAILGTAGIASAADAPTADQTKPGELSASELDGVTAGVGFGSTARATSGQIKAGAFKLILSGNTWTRGPN